MARLARLSLPGQAHLVTHRGNNQQAVVLDDVDRQALLDLLGEQSARQGVALHAYAILASSLHLLLTPSTVEGLPAMMQAVGRGYVRGFNSRHGRSGTLWEGRYRSTVVQPGKPVLECMGFVDRAAISEGLSADPQSFAWSSHRHYTGQIVDRRISAHPAYWSLGNTPFAREAAYAELVRQGPDAGRMAIVRDAAWHGWALGDSAFVDSLQRETSRRLTPTRPGRPRKSAS